MPTAEDSLALRRAAEPARRRRHRRETRPSFTRLTDLREWDRPKLSEMAGHIERMKATGTEIYTIAVDSSGNPREVR